jgi:hypothetical protein
MGEEELIDLTTVLDDMYNPNGGPISWAAEDYYYTHYASKEERILYYKRKEKNEDCIEFIINTIKTSIVLFLIFGISLLCIYYFK